MNIPKEPLNISSNNFGFLPHIGLHKKGTCFVQESSYSLLWFSGFMVAIAITVIFLPWDTMTSFGIKLKYIVAGGLVWSGICGVAPYYVRNIFGQKIIIDPSKRTLTIKQWISEQIISWSDILAFQVCYQSAPWNSETGSGYQLNLVWKDSQGNVQRHCLLKHAFKGFVVALGNKYSSIFHLLLLEQTENSQHFTPADRARVF
ncbi:MAG: hypothetical protein WCY23_03945 [Candidatus Omnitrophota bacterium]